ncbi:MAG: carboxymuconolactone decarboxylase family protein [Proteobacteria bacterium]|nr:carboxymuconolactone decarboxylase family protein [Pseudomonadota bacterium]
MSEKFDQGKPLAELHLGEAGIEAAGNTSPELLKFVVEHGFADMYTDESFDQRSRKIATLASLVTSGRLPQLEWHIRGALEKELMNKDEIKQLIIQMTIYIGYPSAFNAMTVANKVFEEFN